MWRLVIYLSCLGAIFALVASENCLRELSMTQLLRIKKSLKEFTCDVKYCNSAGRSKKSDELEAESRIATSTVTLHGVNKVLPLTGLNLRRSYDTWEEKPTKIQTVFQLSITALSFLAFGGYLLCMIVQAIKSKGTTYYHTMTNGNGNGNGNGNVFRRVKVYGRSGRSLSKFNTTKLPTDDKITFLTPDELYQVMIQMAEGYVKISE